MIYLPRINRKLPEYEAEKSLFPNFKIEGQFKIVKLFILDGVDGGSTLSTWVLEILATCNILFLTQGLFVREDVTFSVAPLGGPVLGLRTVQNTIRANVVEFVDLMMRLVSPQEKQLVQ